MSNPGRAVDGAQCAGRACTHELALSEGPTSGPVQAALASATSFTAGAALALAVVALARASPMSAAVAGSSLVFLAALGALAMAPTADVGALFGTVVG